jgi:hypothetical protein
MEPAGAIINLILAICALILAIGWAVFPFVVIGKLNRILEAMEEIKETLVWQKTADDPMADQEEAKK